MDTFFLSATSSFYEAGYSGMLLLSVKRLQHNANVDLAYGRSHEFYLTPFDVTQIGQAFTRCVKGLLIIIYVHAE